MKRYDQYIDSGIRWIGQMPEHWKLKRTAIMFTENRMKNSKYEFKHAMKFNYGNLIPKNEQGDVSEFRETYEAYTIINKDDIAINCLNLNYDFVSQRVAISPQKGIITSAYLIMSARHGINPYFCTYLFKAMDSMKLFHGMGTGIRLTLSYSELKKQLLPVPPLTEQHTIVTYLNTKINKINNYIATAEKKIAALNELKQVIIADAITHGIRPNVPIKDSGIRWIGKVPKHWEMKRTAIMFTENKTKNSKYEFKHAMKFNYGSLIPKNEQGDISEFRETYEAYTIINKDDIAINCLNLNYDFVSQRVAIAPQKGIITSAYLIMSARSGVNPYFFTYLFKAMDSIKFFHGMGTGIRLTLSYNELKKQFLPVPPLSEQEEIVSYIDRKVAQIDKMRNTELTQIEKLKEYKQRLISDVVTGKIKV